MKTNLCLLLTVLTLAACAKDQSQNRYNYNEVGQSRIVEFATVIDVHEVDITGRNTGAGALIGAGAGAGGGSYAGNGSGQAWAAVGGALAGAAIGAAAEQGLANRKGLEYTLVTEAGKPLTIVQNMDEKDQILPKGSRVILQTTGSYRRVLPAEHLPETIKRPKGLKVVD